jgi:hypothetical protein
MGGNRAQEALHEPPTCEAYSDFDTRVPAGWNAPTPKPTTPSKVPLS